MPSSCKLLCDHVQYYQQCNSAQNKVNSPRYVLFSNIVMLLFPVLVISDILKDRNCNCKYNKLYSTAGGKPLLGCFTRTFTVSAISNTLDHRSSTVSTAF